MLILAWKKKKEMCNVDDPAIAKAYADVRNDKTGLNWCVFFFFNNVFALLFVSWQRGSFLEY